VIVVTGAGFGSGEGVAVDLIERLGPRGAFRSLGYTYATLSGAFQFNVPLTRLEGLAPGTYTVKATSEGGIVAYAALIVK
jgi:hypothetical protein